MIVYILLEEIDLGDQIEGVYKDKEEANAFCSKLNKEWFLTHTGNNKYRVEEYEVI